VAQRRWRCGSSGGGLSEGGDLPFPSAGKQNGLYMMNADGSDMRRLAASLDVRDAPSWSPDGKFIAVAADEGDGSRLVQSAGRRRSAFSAGRRTLAPARLVSRRQPDPLCNAVAGRNERGEGGDT